MEAIDKILATVHSSSNLAAWRKHRAAAKLMTNAEKDFAVREQLFFEAVRDPEGVLMVELRSRSWRPSQPELRMVFLLLIGAIQELERSDNDPQRPFLHLKRAYDSGDEQLRRVMKAELKKTRDARFQALLESSPQSDSQPRPAAEQQALAAALKHNDFKGAIGLLRTARIGDAFTCLKVILASGFRGSDPETERFLRETGPWCTVLDHCLDTLKSSLNELPQYYNRTFKLLEANLPSLYEFFGSEGEFVAALTWLPALLSGGENASTEIGGMLQSPHWLHRSIALTFCAQRTAYWRLERFLAGCRDSNYWVIYSALLGLPLVPVSVEPVVVKLLQQLRQNFQADQLITALLNFTVNVQLHFMTSSELIPETGAAADNLTGGEANAPNQPPAIEKGLP